MIAVCASVVLASHASADIAAPPDFYNGGVSNSLEGIFSIEKLFSRRAAFLLWLGGGVAGEVETEFYDNHSTGVEGAVEFRVYLMSETAENAFIGVYCGVGCMHGPKPTRGEYVYDKDDYDIYTIQGLGAKAGYKWIALGRDAELPSLRMALEPYWSIGVTYYFVDSPKPETPKATWLNIGLRVVLEYPLP